MKFKLEWVYKSKENKTALFTSEWLDAETAILIGEELSRSGKAIELRFHDEMLASWSLKEMKKLTMEMETKPHEVTVYFDGGFNKETNEAGLGAVIYYKQGKKKYRLRANELISGLDTNNEAEYAALYYALTLIEELGVRHLPCEIKGDSQGVLKQLQGEWPCYEEHLNRWLDRIEDKMNRLGIKPEYVILPRNENKEADKLAGQALRGKKIRSKVQII